MLHNTYIFDTDETFLPYQRNHNISSFQYADHVFMHLYLLRCLI